MRNRCTNHLKKAKIRQSWSKYNLYNLSRFRDPQFHRQSFFQQKWASKSAARSYHGEQVPEKQWERMFQRRLKAVIPMNSKYLAINDGSNESAGRGSGKSAPSTERSGKPTSSIPYMQMTFAPLERRLDTAIFRALFASSTRQARQFVVHGAVTVNGKKMQHPGYLLNPGDLFQVEPERVMYATGAPKDRAERRATRLLKRGTKESEEGKEEETSTEAEKSKEPEKDEDPREMLKYLRTEAKNILSNARDTLPAKRKQSIRGFQKTVKRVLSRTSLSTTLTDNLEAQFLELKKLLGKDSEKKKEDSKGAKDTKAAQVESSDAAETAPAVEVQASEPLTKAFEQAARNPEKALDEEATADLSDEELDILKQALVQMRDNPIDSSKPYATPWRPRDYMSPFAFIPRYLEVNQNICAAVYLRHPVARPGYSEVPSPFSEAIATGAFGWYLRRR